MSEIPPETAVVQPNGLPPQQTQQHQEPVVGFSPEPGVNPGVNIIPPASVALEDQSAVIT